MISNRQSPKLEIDVSYTKQRADDFLFANFGALSAEEAVGLFQGLHGVSSRSAEIRKQPKYRGMNDIIFSNR
jgi:hypothetical protein